jgi:large subunit ribosomal protein L25
MTDNKITFHVHERKIFGKAAKKLKQAGLIPANIYGLNQESVSISLDKKMVEKQLKVSETGLVYLELDDQKKPIPVLIDLVERHVLTTDLQHITFKRVSLTEKVVTDVELVLVGENSVPNATVLQVLDALEVESLPTEIPESIEIDISELTEVGQVITIRDLIDRTKLAIVCEEDQLEDPVPPAMASRPPAPSSRFAPLLPIKVFAKELPVPLRLAEPVNSSPSRFAPKV